LLGGSSLKLAFHQAGVQSLAGDVSTGVFRTIVPEKFRKYIFFAFAQHLTSWEACRPAFGVF
jgi:hypothetical protein